MTVEEMLEAFDQGERVTWDCFGQLREADPLVHFELCFSGPNEIVHSKVDDVENPVFGHEAWDLIVKTGSDEHLEAFLSGYLVGHTYPIGVPVGV